jgi:hypothetical protein
LRASADDDEVHGVNAEQHSRDLCWRSPGSTSVAFRYVRERIGAARWWSVAAVHTGALESASRAS